MMRSLSHTKRESLRHCNTAMMENTCFWRESPTEMSNIYSMGRVWTDNKIELLNVAETWSSMFPSHLRNAETWDFVLCLWLENFEQQVRPNYKPINFRKWASRTIIDIILSPCLPHFRALFSPPKHVCKVSRISIAWPSESGTLPHAVISKVSLTSWLSLLSFVYESLVKYSLLEMVSPFSMQFF